MEEFPDVASRTDWLINELEATQPAPAEQPEVVLLSQIQRIVRKVAQQFSTLASILFSDIHAITDIILMTVM